MSIGQKVPHMVFVGGTGRSGTSIVKEMLARHPDAASLPFEYRFIIDPDGLVDFYSSLSSTWSPYLADRRLKRLQRLLGNLTQEPLRHRVLGRLIRWMNSDGKVLSPRTYHGWELECHLPNFQRHIDNLMAQLVEFSFSACWVGTESYQRFPKIDHVAPQSRRELAQILGDFIKSVIDDFLRNTGKTFFVEDNTWNVFFAREILELVPEAKIVHVYRDPRDVVASFSHQRWSPNDREQGARWYKAMMTHSFNVRSDLPIGSYLELKLEDLVAAPEEMLRRMCGFIGIPFHQRMLHVDLSQSHSGRWLAEFSEQEKETVQAILANVIQELGYDLEGKEPRLELWR